MQFKPLVFFSLLPAFVASCTYEDEKLPEDDVHITALYDMTADFSAFQTYDLVEPPADQMAPAPYIEANRIAVVQSIIREMEERDYVRDQDEPDLRLVAFVKREDVTVTEEALWWDYYYGYYWGYGYPWYESDVTVLEVGTLIIDAVDIRDPANEDDDVLVYRGIATAVIPPNPTDLSDELPDIVSRMFDAWPSE